MTTIFENDLIEVTEAENGSYSFITIDNKTNGRICVHYDGPGYNDNYDPIVINPNRQVILLTEEENRDWIEAFKRNQIYIVTDSDEIVRYPTGCSMTQWNEDCEEITNEKEVRKMTYREQLNKLKELGITPTSIEIADLCDGSFEFNYSDEEFEKLCRFAEEMYLKSDTLTIDAIVKCINDIIRTKRARSFQSTEQIVEGILKMDELDFIDQASAYFD